jgi:hypothetical protein
VQEHRSTAKTPSAKKAIPLDTTVPSVILSEAKNPGFESYASVKNAGILRFAQNDRQGVSLYECRTFRWTTYDMMPFL